MKKLILPNMLKHKQCEDLIRVGSDNDGGYLISVSDLKKTEALLSFGLDVDWNFEKMFSDNSDIPIYAYDASTNFTLFVKKSLSEFFHLNFLKSINLILKYFKFKNFFKRKKKFIQTFVGPGNNKNYVSFDEIISKKNYKNYFIKMDIEGGEYRILDNFIKHQDKICGTVIEFHDIDLHLEKIERFISNFNLNIVHVHINNWTIIGKKDLPLTIEVTFSKNAKINNNIAHYPNELDQPNAPHLEDFVVSFNG